MKKRVFQVIWGLSRGARSFKVVGPVAGGGVPHFLTGNFAKEIESTIIF
jgi:hypothetical protein